MPSQPAPQAPQFAKVHDLTARRIERALARRQRYRYVQPVVRGHERGWVIASPCWSRNVDPSGGEIPIAWLEPHAGGWSLYQRHHADSSWVLHSQAPWLAELLDIVCRDGSRVFWP